MRTRNQLKGTNVISFGSGYDVLFSPARRG